MSDSPRRRLREIACHHSRDGAHPSVFAPTHRLYVELGSAEEIPQHIGSPVGDDVHPTPIGYLAPSSA